MRSKKDLLKRLSIKTIYGFVGDGPVFYLYIVFFSIKMAIYLQGYVLYYPCIFMRFNRVNKQFPKGIFIHVSENTERMA